jgi:hypothetical protein
MGEKPMSAVPRSRALAGEHGAIRLAVRVGRENPATVDALRILARLLVARRRQNQPPAVAFDAPEPLTVPRGVAG